MMISLHGVEDEIRTLWCAGGHGLREFLWLGVYDAEPCAQLEFRTVTVVDGETLWAKSRLSYKALQLSRPSNGMKKLLSESIDASVEAMTEQMVDRLYAIAPGTLQ